MALWSEVELLTNEDTNTVRFDGVSREENSSGLYQVDTLVKVSSANEVQADPNLTSSSGSNWSFIVADRTVILFDQSYQSILLLLNFETDVDAIDVCLKGKFLVVCERNGNLHLIYVPQKRILLTRALVEKPNGDKKTYCYLIMDEDKASSGMYHMFLLIKDGFFHITNLSLAKIESAIEKMDVGALKELQSLIKIDFYSTKDYHEEGCSTAVMFSLGHEVHLMIGVSVYQCVRKMVVVDNLLYILDTEDVLSLWDLHFLVMIHCWPELAVHDFQLTAECGSASMVAQDKGSMKMIMLTKQDNSQISSLQIRFLPSMTVCYSLDVSFVSCLVHTKINMDAFYLVEGICENPESRREPVASVVVRSFTEALPENRLSRLLHKHMFEEAEKFAITFELDLELVYKVKLDFVLEQLASASVGGYGEDVWSELVEEAKTNLMKITVSIITVLSSSCQLREGDMKGAQLLWLRYEGQIATKFSESSLEAILSAIPEDLPSQDLCLWFKTVFVPFVRRVLPQGQRILAKWLEQKARNLELTEKRAWPQNGLDLAVLGLPSLWTWMKSDNSNCVEEVENLKSLVSNLRQLLDLHQKYNCSLSLSVFEKKTVWSVAFFMLDKVAAPELIAATVENSIRPYTEEHKIPFDELLLQYIKDLLERCSSQTTTLFTEWEAKAVAVLGCMTDTDLMVDAVLEIMQKAVVPWSNVVEKLVQQYLEMDGPKYDYIIVSFNGYQALRLTSWARMQLEDKEHISDEHKKHQMVIAQVMVETLKYLHIIQKHDALKSVECENNLIMFKAIAHLQEDFDIFFTPSNYEDPNIRKQIQEHHITAYENTRGRRSCKGKATTTPVVANDPDGKTKTISTEAGLRRLGRQLQRTEQELWSDLALRALKVGKVDKALKILSELYEHHYNSSTGKVLFTAAKMLCHMLEADVPMVLPDGMDLPAVIHDLACQAITVCHSDLLLDCLELCKCTRFAMDVYHQCQLSDNYGFIVKDLTPEAESSNYLRPLFGPLANMLQMLQECSQLELALRVLVNAYGSCLQHVTSNVMDIKLSLQLYDAQELKKYNLCLNDHRKTTTSTLNAVAVPLLNKVLNWRVVDCDLAIGLCTLLSKAEVFKILWKVIDNTWQNYDKILAVARIGANLCSLYNEAEEQRRFLSVITDAEWGIKLGKLEISIQPVFRQRSEMKSTLIPVLVKNKRITPDIILQYCSTYDLDHDSVINQYITTLLLLQEDEEGAGDPAVGQEEAQPLSHTDTLDRVLQIIPMLRNTSKLTDNLCAAIFKLSPYNYERIEVVLKIIQAADENVTSLSVGQAMGLLQHLKSYTRVSPPTDVENTHLLETGLLPNPLSSSRLPFHLLMQTKHYWKIICPELSEETFPTLLLISKLMKVSLDKLYMSAANHVFEKKMKPLILEQRKMGQGHCQNKETFKVAKTMMKYIKCIQSPEWAAATAHKITQELPPGYEKTQSLRFCLALGDTWLKDPHLDEAARARGDTFLSKLKLQFQRSATENTLISSQLNSPELMKLSGLPGRLIMALYEHSSVEQRYKESGGQTYPDIHGAVKEIATVNNVDLLKIRTMLLEKWICKTGPAVVKDIGYSDCVSNIEEDPDLMRVVYMLQSCSMQDAVRHLSPILTAETWPLSTSGPRLTFCHRTRALLCLVRLADAPILEAQLQIPITKIPYYLKCYIFVSQLEALNIPYTVQSFLSSPKEGLVKGLWKNHSHEPQAVRLVADLCLEYQIYDPQLWNSLLQKLLGFNLISHLQKVLEAIVAVPALWEISSFSRTWRSMILAPFVSASVPLSPDQQAMLYRTFVLLLKYASLTFSYNHQTDSFMDFLCFNRVAYCIVLPKQGVVLLQEWYKYWLEHLISVPQCSQISSENDQGMQGCCSRCMQASRVPVRETVLTFISQNGQHQKLLKTKHFSHLKQLIVSSGQPNQVKDLVDYLISQNCHDDAESLAREYIKHRERQRGKTLTNGSLSSSCLKDFLNMQHGVLR
ncbi:kinetochore-associated protein 1 [Neolamprologus brichardi]|uniref:kinetochore-associated protein 1 n=1 Tax=Neolamprologus brichardi TaxID=32507 RepID=UPI0016438E51|nr:kinetochore-associated protein 1 [Neolamprologus brichardi]